MNEGQEGFAQIPLSSEFRAGFLKIQGRSASVSTKVWCERGLVQVLTLSSNPQNCRKKNNMQEKGSFIFCAKLGNGRNTVSRVVFLRRELTEFCKKLGELAVTHKQ